MRYWRQQKSDQVILAYLRFVHLVPVGKIASLGLRRRRIAETPLQLLCDAIKLRFVSCVGIASLKIDARIWSVGV